MIDFVSQLRVFLLLWTLLVVSTTSDKHKESSDAGMVIGFIEKIIKPYLDTQNNDHSNGKPAPRTREHTIVTEIKNVIRLKVIQLKPLLQDDENKMNKNIETDSSLNLDGNDETVILELMPEKMRRSKVKLAVKETKKSADTFKKKIENYKQIRKHITLLLDKENTSNSTNKLITTTLDEMLDLLVKKQCKWKSVYTGDLTKYFDKNSRRTMQKVKNKAKILDQYRLACYLKPKNKEPEEDYYFRHAHSSTEPSGTDLYQENIGRDQNQCGTFIICSDELRDFLEITYNYLNDTATATFKNYVAMYTRDVQKKTESLPDIVSSELESLSKFAESKVHKIFLTELENFTLDKNKNKSADIKHLNKFIKDTSVHITNSLIILVENQLSAMKKKYKLFSTIKDDLIVNLRTDMNNLHQLIAGKICGFFVLCNGIGARRSNRPGKFRPKDIENVYFKVKLSFDDEMKDALARFGNLSNQNSIQGDMTSIYSFGKSLIDTISKMKYSYVNVTRTSVSSSATTATIASSEDLLEQFF